MSVRFAAEKAEWQHRLGGAIVGRLRPAFVRPLVFAERYQSGNAGEFLQVDGRGVLVMCRGIGPADGDRRQRALWGCHREEPRKARRRGVADRDDRGGSQLGVSRSIREISEHAVEVIESALIVSELHVHRRRDPDLGEAEFRHGLSKGGVLEDRLFLHVVLPDDDRADELTVVRYVEERTRMVVGLAGYGRPDRHRPLPLRRRRQRGVRQQE
jgi:hypothetical protein